MGHRQSRRKCQYTSISKDSIYRRLNGNTNIFRYPATTVSSTIQKDSTYTPISHDNCIVRHLVCKEHIHRYTTTIVSSSTWTVAQLYPNISQLWHPTHNSGGGNWITRSVFIFRYLTTTVSSIAYAVSKYTTINALTAT